MSEKTKHCEKEISKPQKPATGEQGNWSEDQQKKSYYYDDSYGYEVYDPDAEEDEEDDE